MASIITASVAALFAGIFVMTLVMTEIMTAHGPDSFIGLLSCTLMGSTETTFYVLAVYFGAVQIRRIRHALAAGLSADLAGVIAAVVICSVLFGSLAG